MLRAPEAALTAVWPSDGSRVPGGAFLKLNATNAGLLGSKWKLRPPGVHFLKERSLHWKAVWFWVDFQLFPVCQGYQ